MGNFSQAFSALFAFLTSLFNGLNGFARGFESIGNVVAESAAIHEEEAKEDRAIRIEERKLARAKQAHKIEQEKKLLITQ